MASPPLPAWLRRKLKEETRSGNNGGLFDMAQAVAGVPEGQRDDQMFRLASLLRGKGVDRDVAEGVVLHAAASCDPPFPEEEARQKVENAFRYEAGTPRRVPGTDTTDAADTGHRLRELSEAPPFPVEALPKSCRRLVEEAAGSIVCPPEFIAVPLLVALGSAIGTSRVARLKRGWTESAAVYAAIVALPGKKKTPALKVATEAARAKQGDLRQEYRDAKEDYEAEVRQWEADKKAAAKEGEPAPEQPQKPTMKRTVVDDTTVEALAAVLEGNPRGVLVTKDELSGWVRSMDQYKAGGKGTDRQFYLSAWSNSPVTVDRKNLEEPLFLLKPFVGVVGSVQPAVLSELTANRHGLEGDGLLDRFVFAYPEPMPSRWSDQEISAAAVIGARRLYEDLLTKLELDYQENGDPEPRTVDLSGDARTRFREEANTLQEETEQPGFPNVLRGPWSKLEAYLARLALVLAMARAVSVPTHGEERVELEDVEAAAALLQYFKAHARRAYLQLYGERREDRLLADLTKLLKENLGNWEGDPTKGWEDPAKKLFETLKERGCDALPTRPDELAKEVLALSSHIPSLKARRGKRGDERVLRIWVVEPPLPVVSGVRGVRDVRLWDSDGPDADPDGADNNDPGGGPTDPEDPCPSGSGAYTPDISSPLEEPPDEETTVRETGEESDGLPRNGFNLLAKTEDVSALVEEIQAAEVVALDLETTGLDPRRHATRLLSLATDRGVWVIDLFATDPSAILEKLGEKTLVIHNAAFDLGFLYQLGYEHRGEVIDTMLLSQMLYAGANRTPLRKGRTSHSLDSVVERELGEALDKEHQTSDWADELSSEMVEYAARDAEVLIALHCTLMGKIEKAKLSRVLQVEQRAQRGILWMACSGLPFDEARWLGLAEEAKEEAAHLKERLLEGAPPHSDGKRWNWNSPQQVKQALSMLGLSVENTKDETLARIDNPFVRLLREYKKKNGIATRHGEKWLYSKDGSARVIDGRLYPSWKQIGAATGRMACAEPNLQAIPHGSGHHSCVRAPEGRTLVKADYSQIELRLAAKMWGEPVMLETFREGGDVHEATAKSITGKKEVTKEERKLAKAVNFGLIFGQGAKGLKDYAKNTYGVEMTLEEATAHRTRFFQTYQGIVRWHAADDARLRRGQFDTRTMTGRRRRDVRSYAEHLNAPVQGTAADGMKMALALLWERRGECPGAVPILAVHDEIVVECDEEDAEKVEGWLKKSMVDGMDAVVDGTEPHVPIEVEATVSKTWG